MATRAERAPLVLGLIRNYISWIVLVIVVVAFSIATPAFFTSENLMTWLNLACIIGLVAIGETFVILAGGFDLSVGSLMLVGGMVFGTLFMNLHLPVGAAMLAGLAATTGLGLANGLMVTKVKLPAFIATFATMFVFSGITLAIGKGLPVYFIKGPYITFLGRGRVGELPMPALIFIIIAIAAYLIASRTRFGRAAYAVGGNEKAAHMSGINVDRIRLVTYVVSGFLCGLAGLVLTARLESAGVVMASLAGFSTTLIDVIAAVMIGGISIFGGKGTMLGLIGGVLLVQALSTGMGILGVVTPYHILTKGALILFAVGLELYFRYGVSLRRR